VQPTPTRGAAAGLLLGLIGSAAFTWLLNSRRMARPGWAAAGQVPGAAGVDEGRPPERDHAPEGRVAGGWSDADLAAGNGNGHGAQRRGVFAVLSKWQTSQRPRDPDEVEGNGATLQGRQTHATSSLLDGRPEAVSASVGPSGNDLVAMFARVAATLPDEPVDWLLENLPQRMAEQVIMIVYADVVTLLLDDGVGAFEVAGSIGLTAEEQGVAVDVASDILGEALKQGASVFQGANPAPPSAVDLLPGGRNAEAIVLVPLVESSSWLGMLLVGRRRLSSGQRDVAFSDEEIAHVIRYAMEIAPRLQALLLLDELQSSPLRSLDARTERTADSG
jgi:hypothetical protein